ncbi:hypothetical protein DL96DRAFT_1594494 [Flagelloscypha sp. PMI_526]|nr:hypothetical protein DL96DRAFT_1594494 [Flagelloscypha sp. PMI_526]
MLGFIGTIVDTPSLGQLSIRHNQLLIVSNEGLITHLESFSSATSEAAIQALNSSQIIKIPNGSFLLPTFCDLHLHAPQFLYQGNGLHLPLMQWLDKYAFKAEERLDSDSNLAERVYKRLGQRLIQNGTGTVLLFGTIKNETNIVLARVMQEAGIRAFVGKLSMDISTRPTYCEPSSAEAIEAATRFVADCKALVASLPPHLRFVAPVPYASFSDVRIQSHLAEAKDQVEWVRLERGKEDIDVFDEAKLLTPRTIQAHCTFLDNPSLSRLHSAGTSVAHCPLSNSYFSAKPFPLREALDLMVKVGLGTDIAGGYSADIMNSMRQAVISWHGTNDRKLDIDWKEALFLSTKGGTEALGLQTGAFRVGGASACSILVSGEGMGDLDFFDDSHRSDEWVLTEDILEKWWCLGNHTNRVARL